MSTIQDRHKPEQLTKVSGNGFNRKTLFVVERQDFDRLMCDAVALEMLLERAVPYIKMSADHPASDGTEYELLGRIEFALNKTL